MRFYRGIACLTLLLVGITASTSAHRLVPDAIGTSTGLYLYAMATHNQTSNFDFYSQPVDDVA